VSLNDNPIYLTQKRLVHRAGVLVAILIASLIGASLLSGMIASIAVPNNFSDIGTPQDAGKMFYGWTIGVEIVVLIIGGFVRISRIIVEERKAGLWDSNRLTPLKPWQIIIGYWFGAPLREFYMSVVLACIGLVIVVLGKLPLTFWLGTQALIFSTALFFGLLAVLLGIVLQKPQGGIVIVVAIIFLQFFSFSMPKFFVPDFLLPVYPIVNLFENIGPHGPNYSGDYGWNAWGKLPELFGFPIYPVILTLGLQLLIGIFAWRIVIRKTVNPFQPPLLRWEAVAVFAILLLFQHGLLWGAWHGRFPTWAEPDRPDLGDSALAIVHIGTMLLAVIVLALISPQPESIRLKVLRTGLKTPCVFFSESSVGLAFALTAVTAIILFSHFAGSIADNWKIYLIVVGNLLAFTLIFSLLLEYCRLRYKRRALGFVVLWLFVVCVLPFILAGVFQQVGFIKISLLAPGCAVLGDPNSPNSDSSLGSLNCLLGIVMGHLLIAVLIFIGWQREWKKLLARAV
jgi:hypothetical protein